MKKVLFAAAALLLTAASVSAQSYSSVKDKLMFSWEIAIPMNNNFINKTSLNGAKFEYRRMIKPNLSIGGAINWNSYNQYIGTTTYQTKNQNGAGAVTTDMIANVYSIPMTANVNYYFKAGKCVHPYAGLGIGAQYSDQTSYFNVYGIDETNWGFLVRPEVGVEMPFYKTTAAFVSAAYAYSTNKNQVADVSGFSKIAVNIGVVVGL